MNEEEKRKMIIKLHNETGIGLAACKKALECKGFDEAKAIEYLEEQTIAVRRINLNQSRL